MGRAQAGRNAEGQTLALFTGQQQRDKSVSCSLLVALMNVQAGACRQKYQQKQEPLLFSFFSFYIDGLAPCACRGSIMETGPPLFLWSPLASLPLADRCAGGGMESASGSFAITADGTFHLALPSSTSAVLALQGKRSQSGDQGRGGVAGRGGGKGRGGRGGEEGGGHGERKRQLRHHG